MRLPVSFRITEEAGISTLVVQGHLGHNDVLRLQTELETLTGTGSRSVILDLTACPYMPSMGIPPLIKADQTLATDGRKLLISAHPELLEIFRVLRLDRKLLIHESLDDCVRAALHIASGNN
jgi:anti-anti-sigma factor